MGRCEMIGKMLKTSLVIALILIVVFTVILMIIDYLEAEKIKKEREAVVLDEYGVEVEYVDFDGYDEKMVFEDDLDDVVPGTEVTKIIKDGGGFKISISKPILSSKMNEALQKNGYHYIMVNQTGGAVEKNDFYNQFGGFSAILFYEPGISIRIFVDKKPIATKGLGNHQLNFCYEPDQNDGVLVYYTSGMAAPLDEEIEINDEEKAIMQMDRNR